MTSNTESTCKSRAESRTAVAGATRRREVENGVKTLHVLPIRFDAFYFCADDTLSYTPEITMGNADLEWEAEVVLPARYWRTSQSGEKLSPPSSSLVVAALPHSATTLLPKIFRPRYRCPVSSVGGGHNFLGRLDDEPFHGVERDRRGVAGNERERLGKSTHVEDSEKGPRTAVFITPHVTSPLTLGGLTGEGDNAGGKWSRSQTPYEGWTGRIMLKGRKHCTREMRGVRNYATCMRWIDLERNDEELFVGRWETRTCVWRCLFGEIGEGASSLEKKDTDRPAPAVSRRKCITCVTPSPLEPPTRNTPCKRGSSEGPRKNVRCGDDIVSLSLAQTSTPYVDLTPGDERNRHFVAKAMPILDVGGVGDADHLEFPGFGANGGRWEHDALQSLSPKGSPASGVRIMDAAGAVRAAGKMLALRICMRDEAEVRPRKQAGNMSIPVVWSPITRCRDQHFFAPFVAQWELCFWRTRKRRQHCLMRVRELDVGIAWVDLARHWSSEKTMRYQSPTSMIITFHAGAEPSHDNSVRVKSLIDTPRLCFLHYNYRELTPAIVENKMCLEFAIAIVTAAARGREGSRQECRVTFGPTFAWTKLLRECENLVRGAASWHGSEPATGNLGHRSARSQVDKYEQDSGTELEGQATATRVKGNGPDAGTRGDHAPVEALEEDDREQTFTGHPSTHLKVTPPPSSSLTVALLRSATALKAARLFLYIANSDKHVLTGVSVPGISVGGWRFWGSLSPNILRGLDEPFHGTGQWGCTQRRCTGERIVVGCSSHLCRGSERERRRRVRSGFVPMSACLIPMTKAVRYIHEAVHTFKHVPTNELVHRLAYSTCALIELKVAIVTMSTSLQPSSSAPNYHPIFEKALKEYKKKTGKDISTHPLAEEINGCGSIEAVLAVLQGKANELNQSQSSDERLTKWLTPTVNVLNALSSTLGEGVGTVFPPTKIIFSAMSILLVAARGTAASRDVLIELFDRIENFFVRLQTHTEVPSTAQMTNVMGKVMAEVLSILAVATKVMYQSRKKTFLKKLVGRNDIEDALLRLDKLEQGELRMVSAQVLKTTSDLKDTTTDIKDDTKETKLMVQQIVSDVSSREWERFRGWLTPPDPSTNHINACSTQHDCTAAWVFNDDIFKDWESSQSGSLLWIHGKAG
ncbi:hypothetical protein EDB86DRAFT_3242651, partial [Lactarius hatsudake]